MQTKAPPLERAEQLASAAQTEALSLERTFQALERAKQLSPKEQAEALLLERTFGHSSG